MLKWLNSRCEYTERFIRMVKFSFPRISLKYSSIIVLLNKHFSALIRVMCSFRIVRFFASLSSGMYFNSKIDLWLVFFLDLFECSSYTIPIGFLVFLFYRISWSYSLPIVEIDDFFSLYKFPVFTVYSAFLIWENFWLCLLIYSTYTLINVSLCPWWTCF